MDRYDSDRPRRRPRAYDDRDDRYDYDDRGFVDRASDEVRSWFGDDDARRRRALDERYDDRGVDPDDLDRDYNRDYARRYGSRPSGRRSAGRSGSALRDDADFMDRRDRYGRSNRPYERDTRFGFDFGLRDQDRDVVHDRDYGLSTDLGYGGRRRRRGPHAGRGPKGYRRRDDRVVEDVNERLTENGFLDATHIRVSASDGEVTLEGTVPSRYEKRLADDLAEQVRGVRDVHNRLTISDASSDETSRSDDASQTGAGSAASARTTPTPRSAAPASTARPTSTGSSQAGASQAGTSHTPGAGTSGAGTSGMGSTS